MWNIDYSYYYSSPAARENARLKLHFTPSPPASRENDQG